MSKQDLTKTWASLSAGDRVQVSEASGYPYEATVDVLTEDARVVWVFPDSGDIRKAFDCREEEVVIRHLRG